MAMRMVLVLAQLNVNGILQHSTETRKVIFSTKSSQNFSLLHLLLRNTSTSLASFHGLGTRLVQVYPVFI